MCGDLNMSLRQDVVDIYTKSSVYYLRLQYLIICYLIVLAGAFFVLPMPREIGIDGVARLLIGGWLYIGFVVLMVYAPKLFYPLIGKLLSPYKDEKEVEEKFNRLSEKDRQEVEKAIEAEYGVNYKKNGVLVITMNKMQRVATNVFFQCLLIELFCLVVLINQDHSLMISNPVTQSIAEFLSQYTWNEERDYRFKDGFAFVIDSGERGTIPFSQYAYMAESIFFVHIMFFISAIFRFVSMFIFSRPILANEYVFPIVKNSTRSIGKMIWAILATLIMLIIGMAFPIGWIELDFPVTSIQLIKEGWLGFSCVGISIIILNELIAFRFMEDWYKLIFHKFS
ncbi:MAG: hypothetical protein IK065_07370, partial [Neisseriaceae bacterium]|nr:hypothetical protein [Neisseriaceae bacterium]